LFLKREAYLASILIASKIIIWRKICENKQKLPFPLTFFSLLSQPYLFKLECLLMPLMMFSIMNRRKKVGKNIAKAFPLFK